MTQEESIYYENLKNHPSINNYVFDKLFTVINGITVAKPNVALQLVGGIPMVYNSFTETNTLDSLFPSGTNPPNQVNSNTYSPQSSNKFPQFPIGFKFSNLSTKDIGNNYYGNNPKFDQNGVTVYADDDIPINEGKLDEVKIYGNRYCKEFDNFKLVLFATKNGALLLQQFKECVVADDEVAIFLEINDPTNFFGSVMRVMAGKNIDNSKLPIVEMISFMREKKVNLESKDIIELIVNGKYQTKQGFYSWLYKIFTKTANYVTQFVLSAVDIVDQAIVSFFDSLLIDEKHWNVELKGYSPLFVSDFAYQLLQENTDNDDKIIKHIITPVIDKVKNIEKSVLIYFEVFEKIFPTNVYDLLHNELRKKLKDIDAFIEYIKQADFIAILKASVEIANGLLCGFLNGIVDFFKGFFEIISMALNAVKSITVTTSDPLYTTLLLTEVFENILSIIVKFDFLQFIKNAFLFPITLLSKIINFVSNLKIDLKSINIDINLSKIGYIGGYSLGLLAAIIVDALFTGGVKAVEDIIKALETFLKNPGTVLKDALQTAGRKTVAAIDTIIELISKLARKLKNGAQELFNDFKQFIDDIFKWIEEVLSGKKISQTDLLEDWNNVAGRGRKLGQKLFKSDLVEIEKFLKTLNCELELFPAKGSFEIEGFFVESGKKAILEENAAAVFITDGKKVKLILREKATIYEFFHEYTHLKHAKSIGLQKYYKIGGRNTLGEITKEKYVFDKIIENKDLFTKEELEHALRYLNRDTYYKNGIDPINFDFDIEKIPTVRKEISIKTILNIK